MSGSIEQLLRLLRLVPLATRDGGIGLSEAAELCRVSEKTIVSDFTLLSSRAFYLPAGRTDDFQIFFQGDRVLITAPPAFHRPVRLVLDELLACAIALRCAGLDSAERARICARLEAELALHSSHVEGETGAGRGEIDGAEVEFVLRRASSDDLHGTIARGVVLRKRIRFGYVKDGAEAPEIRRLEPWRVLHAEGESYLLGHDLDRGEPRLFRMDRILGVQLTADDFDHAVPESADEVREDGSVQLVMGEREDRWAEVRYSPRVARWVRERWTGEEGTNGEYTVRHRMLAPDWVVRHVLAYGADAEVMAPPELRRQVVEAVEGAGAVESAETTER